MGANRLTVGAFLLTLCASCSFDASGASAGTAGVSGTGGVGGGGSNGDGGDGGIGGTGGIDAGIVDAPIDAPIDASIDARPPDAPIDAMPDAPVNTGGCTTLNQRVCVNTQTSGFCALMPGGGLGPVADRTCPPTSSCGSGHCQPPGGAATCAAPFCANGVDVCVLYVVGSNLAGFCTPPVPNADGNIAEDCTVDSDCMSGMCAVGPSPNVRMQCMFVCATDPQCPNGSGHCQQLANPPRIEGVPTTSILACQS